MRSNFSNTSKRYNLTGLGSESFSESQRTFVSLSLSLINHLDRLPSELISSILCLVDKKDLFACTLVDKSFYKNAILLLWQELDIDTDDALHTITNTLEASSNNTLGDLVRSITIKCKLSDDDLLAFIKHVPLLNDLSLYAAHHITNASFVQVPLHVPYLTRLYLYDAGITQGSMEAIGRHWQHLERLALVCCEAIDDDDDDSLTQCRTTLTSLENSHHPSAATAQNILALRHLTFLQIMRNKYNTIPSVITAAIGCCDPSPWPHLTSLHLAPCHKVTDTIAMAFLRSHPKLTYFDLNHSLVTDKTLDAIAMYVPEIVHVNVYCSRGITSDGLRQLLKNCRKLETVGCNYCEIIRKIIPIGRFQDGSRDRLRR
ncbi:unnamed protein product [Absidia cylindrospora]